MPNLTVNNNTYAYPDEGSEPGWGSEATDWASAVTEVLSSLSGAGTITEAQSFIQLNATNQDVPGLVFDSAQVIAADITYRVYRTTDSVELSEKGTLHVVYKPNSVDKWYLSRTIDAGDNALMIFDINNTGQIIYSSATIAGTSGTYSGIIRFKTTSIIST